MIPQDIKDMSDEELDNEILRLERLEYERIDAIASLTLRLLDRVKDLERKVARLVLEE